VGQKLLAVSISSALVDMLVGRTTDPFLRIRLLFRHKDSGAVEPVPPPVEGFQFGLVGKVGVSFCLLGIEYAQRGFARFEFRPPS